MRYIMFVAMLVAFVSCNDNDATAPSFQEMDYTFIIYMIADNNLSSNVESNLSGIEAGLANMSKRPKVVAMVDKRTDVPQLISFESADDGTVSRSVIKEYEETNVIDPAFMIGVFDEIRSLYPSSSYALDLWSHGTGWIPVPEDGTSTSYPYLRWFGQDESDYMDIKDLGATLEETGMHFDFILFDACLMATVEVAYEFRNVCDCIIASPIEVWEMGFPYSQIMLAFESEQKEILIAQAYAAYYDGSYSSRYKIDLTGAISVIDCSVLESFAAATRQVLASAEFVYDETFVGDLMLYDRNTYHYLYDFGDYMNNLLGTDAAAPLIDMLGDLMPYRYSTTTFGSGSSVLDLDPERYTGIGTYVPRMAYTRWNEYYKTLQWYEATEFLPIYKTFNQTNDEE